MKKFEQFSMDKKQQANAIGKGQPDWAGKRDTTGKPDWAQNGGRKKYDGDMGDMDEGSDVVVDIDGDNNDIEVVI